ncbi:MAG: type IV pilus modification protein PilV [Xanthomonadaceae bacterium]|nr:type IV pilus modification protein PilV [Xanthomonadaceae bacterium]
MAQCMIRRQSGIGMLEVLIAVLIVSIGFLGMAALQAKALSTNNSAMARSMATVASYSILDAMRTDLTAAESGAYNTTVTTSSCPAPGQTLASVQLNQWCGQLGAALGVADTTQGTVNCSNTADCTVTIQFDDSRAGAGGSQKQQVVTRAGL